ncbi:MAG TPA: hypothetical protein VFW58_08755 [Trichococcus sp.]|nr:hypothetical protein [Trichococcus sp.]
MVTFIKELKRIPRGDVPDFVAAAMPQFYEAIGLPNDVVLSVQASMAHYSVPKKNVAVEDYEAFELTLTKKGEFVSVEDIVKDNSIIEAFKPHKTSSKGSYPFVPAEVIEQLYLYLKK